MIKISLILNFFIHDITEIVYIKYLLLHYNKRHYLKNQENV